MTEGQASEYTHAEALIEEFDANYISADKEYDADSIVYAIVNNNALPVILPKKNRKTARDFDKIFYKERNLVARLFQKLKNYRRIATRYERLARNYQSMLSLVATVIWPN